MDQDAAPRPARPRLNPYTRALRRERIFSQLRLGASCEDIAREEGLSGQRVRKIVADALKRQEVDDGPDHAILQLFRLEQAQRLAAKAVDGGDLKAIAPYLQVLDHLDRYRKAGARKAVYDAAARKKLFAQMNRIVAQMEAKAGRSMRDGAPAPHPAGGPAQPDSSLTP